MTAHLSLAKFYQNYQHPFVRDLAYALACPNAVTNWYLANPHHDITKKIEVHPPSFWHQQFLAYQQRLIELDTTQGYQQLTTFLLNRPSPNRLGFHFEGLLLFWLTDGFSIGVHPFEVVAHNVQMTINCGKQSRTIGELDIIIKNYETNQIEHWELAIKFYLGCYPFTPTNWVGINSKDNLQRKMNHMYQKPFSHDSVELNGKNFNISKRYALIKGRFFKPY